MSISSLFLAVWLILVGVTWSAIYVIDVKFLGLFGLLTGVILLIDSFHPIVWTK